MERWLIGACVQRGVWEQLVLGWKQRRREQGEGGETAPGAGFWRRLGVGGEVFMGSGEVVYDWLAAFGAGVST